MSSRSPSDFKQRLANRMKRQVPDYEGSKMCILEMLSVPSPQITQLVSAAEAAAASEVTTKPQRCKGT